MVSSCSALNCKTRWKSNTNVQFHKFPLGDKTLCEIWIERVGRKDWRPTKTSVLCSKHFSADSYRSSPDLKRRRLLRWAVPTIFDPMPQKTKKKGKKSSGRRRSFEESQNEESSKFDKITGSCLHKFSVQQTAVEVKFGQDSPPKLQKSQEKDRVSSGRRTVEGAQPEESMSCEQISEQCPEQCGIRQTVVEMKDENKKLRKEVRTLQQKMRRRDRTIKRLRKKAGLADD